MAEQNSTRPRTAGAAIVRSLGRLGIYLALAALTGSCTARPGVLEQIRTLGVLKVATRLGPETYYHGIRGPKGPEYELVSEFAATLAVPIEFVPLATEEAVIHEVAIGRAQLGAAALGVLDGNPPSVTFSRPYAQTSLRLVERRDSTPAADLSALADAQIGIVSGSLATRRLMALLHEIPRGPSLIGGHDLPTLLTQLREGELDAALLNDNEWSRLKHYFPDLEPTVRLAEDYALGFALPADDADWRVRVGLFIDRVKPGIPALMKRYHETAPHFDYQTSKTLLDDAVSRLRTLRHFFEASAAEFGEDWRLLAAIGYQESHWDPDAVSGTGVRGIMMLTQQTASDLDVANRQSPEDSIRGGSRYLHELRAALPEHIHEPDRTALALAVYNIGLSHLEDARVLAQRHGKDPDYWRNVREYLPTLATEAAHDTARHGYARGYETVIFVDNIESFAATLEWLYPEGPTPSTSMH